MNPSLSTQDLKAALANTLPQRLALSILSASLVLSACGEVTKPAESALQTDATAISPEAALAKPAVSGIDTAHLAQDILPGDDFYRHVNKHWLDTSKIPVGMASFEPIAELNLSNEKLIAAIIKDAAAKNAPAGTAEQQIADLYASYMDVQGRNQRGFGMLKNSLEEILAAKDRSELVALMARPLYKSLFMLGTNIDTNKPQSYTVATIQYGLGLPSRDYYLNPKEPYLGHRSAYADYITGVFQRAGLANAKARAKAIVAFET
jgi:endothelin-converting enzyme/putative endopeptidase